MSFADTDSTPDKERVVSKSGVFDDTLSGGVGIVVGITNDEVIKSVLRVKVGGVGAGGRSERKERGRVFGGVRRRRDVRLKDELKFVFGFGLIVKSVLEKLMVAFVVDVNQI